MRHAAIAACVLGWATQAMPQENDFAVRIIRYSDLGKIALEKRGKVIIFDFWDLG